MSSGSTNYADGSCQLIGEGDLYGIGVRVSYYLFFFATLIAIIRRTASSSPITKTGPIGKCAAAINILTFAILVVLIRNTRNGSFAALEWFLTYPTILVTFISLCFALPVWDNAGILLCYGFTLCLLTICQPWLYWRRMYQGSKAECDVYYWFFGVRNFYGPTWVTFFKVMSILACIAGIIFFILAVGYALRKVGIKVLLQLAEAEAPVQEHGISPRGDPRHGRGTDDKIRMGLKIFGIAFLFFVGVVTMRMTEMTIEINQINLSATPLDSTSQLIPFLTGLLSFLSTLYSCTPFLSIFDRFVLGKKYTPANSSSHSDAWSQRFNDRSSPSKPGSTYQGGVLMHVIV